MCLCWGRGEGEGRKIVKNSYSSVFMPSFLCKLLRLNYTSLPHFFSISIIFVRVVHDTCSTSSLKLLYRVSFLIYYFIFERHLAIAFWVLIFLILINVALNILAFTFVYKSFYSVCL